MVVLSVIAFSLSIIGCLLCNRKLLLCWPIFIIADIMFSYIYFSKGLLIGAARELVFIALCFEGYYRWKYKNDQST